MSIRAFSYQLLIWSAVALTFESSAMPQSLSVPAKVLPVPETPSPQIQKLIAAPLRANWDALPATAEEWRRFTEPTASAALKALPALIERMHVRVEKTNLDGVRAFIVTPATMPPNNRRRVLINMHGGCYVLFPGEAGLTEAVMMSGLGGFKVIAVDYRMPPEAYFPAALDDGVTVYKNVLKTTDPKRIAIFGTSAGGALTLEIVLRAKQERLPVPGAIAPGTPMSDVTKVGDTFYTNALVDNVLVSPDGYCDAATKEYAAGHDLKDPLLSPVYGDLSGFPPAILTSGTRDLLLSNTVRVHRKLRQAGIVASLQVFEGQSHAHYLRDDSAPETKEAFAEISEFFDQHLAK
jgi:monoterpene epsilon-lactone hydrolase